MDSNHGHCIRRLSLQAEAADQQTGMKLRSLLQGSLTDVTDMLDHELNQVRNRPLENPVENQWLHISKLNMDIQLNPEQLLDRETLLQAIQAQIQKCCQQIESAIATLPQHKTDPNADATIVPQPEDMDADLDITRVSQTQLSQQGLLEYLNTGMLPWYISSEVELSEEWIQQLNDSSQTDRLLAGIRSFEALIRLLSLTSEIDVEPVLLARFTFDSNKDLNKLIPQLWQLTKKQEILSYQQGLAVLAAVMSKTVTATSVNYPSEFSLASPLNTSPAITQWQLQQIFQQLGLDPALQKQLHETLEEVSLLDTASAQPIAINNQPTKSPEKAESRIARLDCAGLILLHPYLPRLFKRLSWLTEDQQIKPDRIEQAAQALCYLATGSFHLPEYKMGGIKLLLNLHPEALLVTSGRGLAPPVVDELDALLNSLLSHWTALKSSSVTGVQEAFLQRQGLLHQRQDHWQLTFERQGIDLLIEHLPFSITTVKLLWMEQSIKVSW